MLPVSGFLFPVITAELDEFSLLLLLLFFLDCALHERANVSDQLGMFIFFVPFNLNMGKIFLEHFNNKIIQDDFISTEHILPNSVDLIVTSPPYNLNINYNSTEDGMTYSKYLEFSEKWLAKAYQVAKSDGRFCLNIPLDKNKGGQQSICADLTNVAKNIGWKYQSTIIWNEGNISRRTAWGSWLSARAPYVIAPVEVIIVLYKESWRKLNLGNSDIERREFIDWTNGIWTFQGESKKKIGHPAPFPIELPKRCIKLFSYTGDVILDPFLGSGTTLIASHTLKRNGIGVEIDPTYCELAKQRLTNEAHIFNTTLIEARVRERG